MASKNSKIKAFKFFKLDFTSVNECLEKFGEIPNEFLFQRKEEFLLSKLTLSSDGNELECIVHVVLGQIFEISITPSIKSVKIKLDRLSLNRIWVNENLCENELEKVPNKT